eukprot:352427-Chlamydomonas_euryale.AAC.13
MEPKVVNACRSAASGSGGWWRYPPRGFLTMSSGAGNNWAHGFSGYGPRVRDATLEMVRREAEACDVLGGFALLQSMAGGTGAGLGTYVAEALRDEYRSAHVVNACVWPYESGEVIVQVWAGPWGQVGAIVCRCGCTSRARSSCRCVPGRGTGWGDRVQ